MRVPTVLLTCLLALPSLAEEAADEPIDPKLQAELEQALAADLATKAATQPAPAPAPIMGAVVQSLNPDLSLIGDFALAAFSSPAPPQTGGHDPLGNGPNLQALELALGAAVDPYLRMDANLAFGPEGFELEEAYATTLALPWNLQVRAGQMLARFGRINATHPHAWDFVDQPLVIGKLLGGDGLRGPGAEISVLTPLPWYVELVLETQSPIDARSFFFESGRVVRSPLDLVYAGAIKQFFALSDDVSLAWGLSALAGPNADADFGRAEVWGTDVYLKYRPIGEASNTVISLTLEALARRRHAYDAAGQGVGPTLVDAGGYAMLFWRFDQRWGAALRGDWVSGLENDSLDPAWTADRPRVAIALTYWPTEFSRVRLQVGHDGGTAESGPVDAALLAFEFNAGAHGAHAF